MKKSFSKEKSFLHCKNIFDQPTKAFVFLTLCLSETIKLSMIMKKSKLFNKLFCSVFTRDYLLNANLIYENYVHNKLVITEKQIVQILSNLDASKACGPDNIGNLILKDLPSCFQRSCFQNCNSKRIFPHLLENQ